MPREARGHIHHDPQYYRIRNHLVDYPGTGSRLRAAHDRRIRSTCVRLVERAPTRAAGSPC